MSPEIHQTGHCVLLVLRNSVTPDALCVDYGWSLVLDPRGSVAPVSTLAFATTIRADASIVSRLIRYLLEGLAVPAAIIGSCHRRPTDEIAFIFPAASHYGALTTS